MKKIWIYILLSLGIVSAHGQSTLKEIVAAVRNAKPGDTIRIPDGSYPNAALLLSADGTAGKPVVVMAASPGGVVFTGNSYMKLAGNYLEVHNLHFTDGYAQKDPVIEFRINNQQLANHCRVSNCVIENYSRPERFNTDSWIVMWGKNNRMDHCTIGDKLNGGTTLIVNLDDERSQKNFHSIDSNFFRRHSRLASNGGETIRVGVSRYSLTASHTQIHHNFFYQCNGEVEIISIKSGNNVISRNTFYECEGGLVLRHGSKNTIEGNIFIGNNKPYTGGVRVINPGHQVYNNLFIDLAGERFRSALGVLNGVPNSAINRYYQVKDADIHHNTFINCANIIFGAGKDAERTLAPENVRFHHNYINTRNSVLYEDANKNGGIIFSANLFTGKAKVLKGFTLYQPSRFFDKGFFSRSFHIPLIKEAGAAVDQLDWIYEQAGAQWLVAVDSTIPPGKIHQLTAARSGDFQQLLDKAGYYDIIELTDGGQYSITSPLIISKPVIIRTPGKNIRPELVNTTEKSLAAFFIIENGVSLTIENIRFNSAYESYGDVQCAITTTTRPMNRHYDLTVNNCVFYNFNETNFSCIRGTKSTYADEILVTNCVFRNNSGMAIDFSAEKEDKGIYNVEVLKVYNCVFTNGLNTAINVYRGGNDESTTGPTVMIEQCTFNEVDNREQGCVIKLIGVQTAAVTNSIFNKSGAGGRCVWFEEMSWDNVKVDYCSFYQSGRIGSFYNKAPGKHIYQLQPWFRDTASYNFSLKPGSALTNKSSTAKAIGAILP